MAQLRFTKIELVRLQKKCHLFKEYLPTLQIKKMVLQTEVGKVREELERQKEIYRHEKNESQMQSKLFTDPLISDLEESLEIESVERVIENIAGIEVPVLKHVVFKEPKNLLLPQPLWADEAILLFQSLKRSYQKILVIQEKKEILKRELRTITIRVNLFEKRLIPQLEDAINKIRIFLGDQNLQAVAQAKVAKGRIVARKKEEEGAFYA